MYKAEFFYSYYVGHGVSAVKTKITQLTLDYLNECNISEDELLKVMEEARKIQVIKQSDLGMWLWKDSLIKPNVAYYSDELVIKNPKPYLDQNGKLVVCSLYREPKIKLTLHNLLLFLYKKTNMPPELRDERRDHGSLAYLIKVFHNIDGIDPIDFIVCCVNFLEQNNIKIFNILDLKNYLFETQETIHRDKKDRNIVWRTDSFLKEIA